MSNRQASSMESLTTEDSSSFLTPPFSSSPVGEGQGFHSRFLLTAGAGGLASSSEDLIDLPLPDIIPVKLPVPRDLTIPRQSPRNDFGFSLRRAMVVERAGGGYALRPVIFAEPGPSAQHQNDTGLLPGDRLLQVCLFIWSMSALFQGYAKPLVSPCTYSRCQKSLPYPTLTHNTEQWRGIHGKLVPATDCQTAAGTCVTSDRGLSAGLKTLSL
ncbi:unconventional myosin-XVIIIa-like [Diaphorina citri]|uniref:Unconventional myosin-XVIIIa-like n=1 Tax=Diaphorina citri TaxID=121845 RepID=A0A3Q0IP56_DIACI|nr:unconventional myosin-XVIIIa-like [Diaphorina citri]